MCDGCEHLCSTDDIHFRSECFLSGVREKANAPDFGRFKYTYSALLAAIFTLLHRLLMIFLVSAL